MASRWLGVRGGGDLGGFAPGAVVAPEVVVVDGLEAGIDRDHAGARGIERDGLDGAAIDAGVLDGAVHGGGQRGHVVGVALRGVVRIFLLAKQRVVGGAGAETALGGVEDGNANAEGAEIYSGDDAHGEAPYIENPSLTVGARIGAATVGPAGTELSYS